MFHKGQFSNVNDDAKERRITTQYNRRQHLQSFLIDLQLVLGTVYATLKISPVHRHSTVEYVLSLGSLSLFRYL